MTTYPGFLSTPSRGSYDVVIIGGAIMGAATAWFLTHRTGFNGSVLVVERDPSFEFASTTHSNSCMRQQFSTELNVRMSQFAADFVTNLRANMGDDSRVPNLPVNSFGYLYLADTAAKADILRANQQVQKKAGAATRILTPQDILAAYPFFALDDIQLGSLNLVNEGYFDGATLCDWWRRQSRERGVDWVAGEVVAMARNASGTRVESITLASGEEISCGQVVNASGPRAAQTAAMAGIALPVEPRKRYSWVFRAETPLDRALPLTVDPSGIYVRENGGGTYHCGSPGFEDPAVDPTDFTMDHSLWDTHIWPTLASRIPQFEAIRVQNEWVGHYAMNTLDQNAIVGPHPEVENFHFLNGFSGHGLQQSPAMGRAMAEQLAYGGYRSLDLSVFGFERIAANRPNVEWAII